MKWIWGHVIGAWFSIHTISAASIPCTALRNEPGLCVPFQECPPLLAVLKSPSITGADINMLKSLTCDYENPKVCCVFRDLLQTTSFNLQPSHHVSNRTVVSSTTGNTEGPAVLIEVASTATPWPQSSSTGTMTIGVEGSYKNHPSFKLLPEVKQCGTPGIEENITGGRDAVHGGHPWMVRIGYRNRDTDEIEFYCAGTVISKRYILTAAHCTEEIDPDYVTEIIQVAEHNTTANPDCSKLGCSYTTDYQIEKIIAHPGYNTDDKFHDIGIIRVNRDIDFNTFVKPICLPFKTDYGIRQLPSKASLTNKKGIVAGWGRTKWNRAEGSTILQEVFLPIVSNEECQNKYSSRTEIIDKQMCAGGIKGKDSCGGDSGGPFILPVQVNLPSIKYIGLKFFQIGVVSYGPVQCGVGVLPGVYSDVQSYLGWVLDNMEP